MASVRWKGKALPVAQVETITFGGTYSAGETVTITINGKSIVLTIGTTATTAQIAAEFETAWNDASTALGTAYSATERGPNIPEFDEITADASGSTLVLTGDVKGKPFTVSVAEGSATGTIGTATTIAASGPNHWSTAANWDTGSVPVNSDSVYIDNSDVDILYGLDQSAVTVALLEIAQSYTGTIGLPETNTDGSDEYLEYREQYLKIGATSCQIGRGQGLGSGRIKINFGSVQTACVVHDSGTPEETDVPAVVLKGTHASNTLTVKGGASVGVAIYGAETATLAPLTVDGAASVLCGAGVTHTGTMAINGGSVEVNSTVATVTQYDGTLVVNGTGGATQLNIYGGLVIWNSTGTIGGNTVIGETARIDFSQDPRAKTVTNPIEAYNPDPVSDPDKTVSSLVIDYNGVSPLASLGINVRLTRGTPA